MRALLESPWTGSGVKGILVSVPALQHWVSHFTSLSFSFLSQAALGSFPRPGGSAEWPVLAATVSNKKKKNPVMGEISLGMKSELRHLISLGLSFPLCQ